MDYADITRRDNEPSKQTGSIKTHKTLRGCADIDTTLCAQTTPHQTADELTNAMPFLQRAQCSHCKRCISYGNSVRPSVCPSVCPSVTRRYCVKTTARSTVQFAPLDSQMCLVLWEPKNIPQGRPLPPEILPQSDQPTPEGCEF